jgi:molecular chaperone DnaK (HSP70)
MLSSINGDEVIALGAARQVNISSKENLSSMFIFSSVILKINMRKFNYQRYVRLETCDVLILFIFEG